ncbi:energy transducer TonB [Neptunomonas japonica]|uniref:energy transducer TonB n=1 Tax=Neptunomonas japonica TaxID=417574 RepID=UPI0006886F39|nr:energy transducer TonB [Neptunomonas japonica]
MLLNHYSIRFLLLLLCSAGVHAFFIWSQQNSAENVGSDRVTASSQSIRLNSRLSNAPKLDAPPIEEKAEPQPQPQPKVAKAAPVVQKTTSKPLEKARSQSRTSESKVVEKVLADNARSSDNSAQKSANLDQSVFVIDHRALNYREAPVQPNYPRMATRRGLEGTVMLVLHISAAGLVERVVIDTSSGYSILDKAAVKAARQWRFVPAVRAGNAVAAQASIPVRFSLVGRK